MDVKLKPLSIIAIAIVCFVTLGLPNTYAQISVETDKSSYGITELIRVSGYIENFNISEPLTITLYQNDVYEIYSRTLEFRKAQGAAEYLLDGYFSTIIIPRDNIPLDWSGKYKVVATYQEQLYSTTFSFIGTDTLQGLSSMSEGGILQIDQKAYEIDQKPISINVDGIVRSIGGTDNFITISLFDEKNVIDFKQLEFSGPISLPDKIAAKLQHNNIIHNISTQFELPIDLPTGLYFIEMFSTKTSWTEREDLITELTGHAPPVDHINIPKIEFIVTNLSENQIISNASTIEPEPIEMKFYENEFNKFSFEIPMNWTIRENVDLPGGQFLETMMYPDEFSPPFSDHYSAIGVSLVEVPVSVLPNLNNAEIENFVVNLKQDPNLSIHNFDIENTSWGWIYTEEYGTVNDNVGGILSVEKGFIFKDRTWYGITYAASDKDFDKFHSVYENVIDTLVINGVQLNNTRVIGQTPVTNSTVPCGTGTIENELGQCVPTSLPVLNNTSAIFSAITDEEQNWILILIAMALVAVLSGIVVGRSRKKQMATPVKESKTKKFCRKCGSIFDPKSKFCRKCGSGIK